MLICRDCNEEIEQPDFWGTIGDPVQCPICRKWWATDWDYMDLEEMSADRWVTGLADPKDIPAGQ